MLLAAGRLNGRAGRAFAAWLIRRQPLSRQATVKISRCRTLFTRIASKSSRRYLPPFFFFASIPLYSFGE